MLRKDMSNDELCKARIVVVMNLLQKNHKMMAIF